MSPKTGDRNFCSQYDWLNKQTLSWFLCDYNTGFYIETKGQEISSQEV